MSDTSCGNPAAAKVQTAALPLILFPGMAADADVFLPQRLALPQVVVPDWPQPLPDENLPAYCQRLAEEVAPWGPCFVGGVSFGGIVALEVARHVDARGCILIGSVRSPTELPLRITMFSPARFLAPAMPVRTLQRAAAFIWRMFRQRISPHRSTIIKQFAGADPVLLRWSLRQLLSWRGSEPGVTVFHIHGERDPVFPVGRTTCDATVAGGGHVISLTHAEEVNVLLREAMRSLDSDFVEK